MLLLLYGGKGWIGKQFVEILKSQNIDYHMSNLRVDKTEEISREIEELNPTHLISFIGRTHGEEFSTIDYLEKKGKIYENVRDNLFSPLTLAMIAKEKNIHFTYTGTGCIFSYPEGHSRSEENGFTEESIPNFFGSSYSTVKGFTDRLMSHFKENTLNLRIRMPITDSYNGRNFITKITSYEKICSIPNSMTVLPELLPLVLDMMKQNKTGTINLTNPGLITHNRILEMYKEIIDPNFQWKNFTVEEQAEILKSERSNNFLETDKLTSLYKVDRIEEAVRKCLYKYKDNLKPSILVTGGCGFIGSNFINHYFNKDNFSILVNIDSMNYCSNITNVNKEIRDHSNYKFYNMDITNREEIRFVLRKHRITHVVHFAAQSHVDNSFNSSLQFTQDNVLGTHILLEESRLHGLIEKFVHVSTDEVYGGLHEDTEEKKETSVLCPTNPYAATKAGAELIAQSYYHSFNFPVIITRGNNVFGRNQYPEKAIPKFISLLKDNKKITIHGNGSSIRDFIHVDDVTRAFEIILERGGIGEIYNIGCDDKNQISILDLAKLLINKIKPGEDYKDWLEYVEDRPFNDKRYNISSNKLHDLGWNITILLEEGLTNLI
tara:strand:- start:892 stop:2706 length:1815 start_codon:yes stop_codon:yes gene_type:complete